MRTGAREIGRLAPTKNGILCDLLRDLCVFMDRVLRPPLVRGRATLPPPLLCSPRAPGPFTGGPYDVRGGARQHP